MSNRQLTFKIFRHNSRDPDSVPFLQEFSLEETERMTLFTALTVIREEMDPTVQFDFVCRSAICGSCGMLVNGRPRLACRTRTEELPREITLLPMPFFKLIGDLSVDTGTWFREMGERVESWIHTARPFEPLAEEERMANEDALAVYELDRCIECGLCVAACGAAQMNPAYVGPVGLMRVARFVADPRDQRPEAEIFDVIGTEDGIFGCIGFLACDDYCPKDLPFATQLAFLRRKMALTGLRGSRDGVAAD